MGNALWCCCKGEDDDDGYVYLGCDDDQHAYYYPAPAAASRPHYQPAAASSPTQGSRLLWPQSPPAPPSKPRLQLHAPPPTTTPVPQGVAVVCSAPASTSRRGLILRPQPPPAAPTPRPQRQLHAPPVPHGVASSTSVSRSSILPPQPAPVPPSRPQKRRPQQPSSPVTHGHGVAVASSTSTCMLLRPQKQKPRQHPPICHGVVAVDSPTPTASRLLRFEHDLLNFVLTKMVPEGLGEHVTSSKKAQAKWYRNISEAYVKTEPPPRTLAEAAMLVAAALGRIQGANLEGVLAFYGFPVPTPPVVTTEHHPASLPDGVQFVLKTLPVYAKCIGDGDGFTAYVDTSDPTESTNVPQEVREAVDAILQTPKHRNRKQKNVLQSKLNKAGYRIIYTSKDEILARQYRFRLRGIDAPEMGMQYGKESQNALVKLIAGKSVMVYVYGQDQYDRCVGDIYCDGVFIQEQMLKEGHACHYKIYDKRKEFAKWEMKARDARRGLWASDNPEKPWDWKRKHNVRHETSDNLDKTREWRRKPHNAGHQNTPEHPNSGDLVYLNLKQ